MYGRPPAGLAGGPSVLLPSPRPGPALQGRTWPQPRSPRPESISSRTSGTDTPVTAPAFLRAFPCWQRVSRLVRQATLLRDPLDLATGPVSPFLADISGAVQRPAACPGPKPVVVGGNCPRPTIARSSG